MYICVIDAFSLYELNDSGMSWEHFYTDSLKLCA